MSRSYSPHWSPRMFVAVIVAIDQNGCEVEYNTLGYDKYGFDCNGQDIAGYTEQHYINDPELYMQQFMIWDKNTPIPGADFTRGE